MGEDTKVMKDTVELSQAIEAILFAAGEPMSVAQLRRVLRRADCDLSALCEEGGLSAGDDEAPEAVTVTADGQGAPSSADAAGAEGSANAAASAAQQQGADAQADADVQAEADVDAEAEVEVEGLEGAGVAAEPEAFALTAPQPPRSKTLSHAIRQALDIIERRWHSQGEACGFTFAEVAGGYTFRTRPAFGAAVAALKEEKPARLSRPAMESLAIVAYRQPVTKPEVDALRGVDSGGTLKVLLDRRLIGVVGKKEEPGRPLLYGTTEGFLSLFNLPSLSALPSLREFNELNADSEDALRAFDGLPSLAELSAGQKQFRMDEAPSIDALDAAVDRLKSTEGMTRSLLLEHGVTLQDGDSDGATAAAPAAAGPAEASTLH
jgi:segregation and condensation protein B